MNPILKTATATLFTFCMLIGFASAQYGPVLSKGQTVYVPIYSHIYGGPKSRPLNVTATLSIRNTDPAYGIEVTAVEYYDSDGKLLKKYVDAPFRLERLATRRFIVEQEDTAGGSGANFIVRWNAGREVNTPVIQGVHISTTSAQGISFLSESRIIEDRSAEKPHPKKTEQ